MKDFDKDDQNQTKDKTITLSHSCTLWGHLPQLSPNPLDLGKICMGFDGTECVFQFLTALMPSLTR